MQRNSSKSGAWYRNGNCMFSVWAPEKNEISLVLKEENADRYVNMEKGDDGYFRVSVERVFPGGRYMYSVEGSAPRPDPASFSQPDGVHGASAIYDNAAFKWSDEKWKCPHIRDMIFYEMHTGVFTEPGTFVSAAEKLGHLKGAGINALNIMPVAQFPGGRNWGYDGVFLYAAQNTYGGPDGLKYLVNECHRNGIAAFLDVVYNHLGPEGNYTGEFGSLFTPKYRTPWGDSVNYDGENSDCVREFIIGNALFWLEHFHFDGLRLDAVHEIYDFSAKHILREIKERVCELSARQSRKLYIIAESDLNDPRVVANQEKGGYELDAQWADDFHHSLHAALTGERAGYYGDFDFVDSLGKCIATPFVYDGQYSAFRKRRHGAGTAGLSPEKFLVFSQNHDQVGNRMLGERLISLAGMEGAKLAAAFTVLSPYIPLLFMGEEYGETAPFLYFTSHGDEDLVKGVREGRKKEFAGFMKDGPEVPDPQDRSTFEKSKLSWKDSGILCLYKKLILIRREYGIAGAKARGSIKDCALSVSLTGEKGKLFCVYNFGREEISVAVPAGGWSAEIDTSGKELTMNKKLTAAPFSAAVIGRKK